MDCINTRKRLAQVKSDLLTELNDLYDAQNVATVADLKRLMEQDNRALLSLCQRAFDDTEEAVLATLVVDGVKYPSFLWNREDVGQCIKLPSLAPLSRHAPVITSASSAPEHRPKQKFVGTGIFLGGGATVAWALACDPISWALLAVGVGLAVGGGVVVWKAPAQPAGGAAKQDHTEEIQTILDRQLESCTEVLNAWFDNVIKLVEAGADRSGEADTGR